MITTQQELLNMLAMHCRLVILKGSANTVACPRKGQKVKQKTAIIELGKVSIIFNNIPATSTVHDRALCEKTFFVATP